MKLRLCSRRVVGHSSEVCATVALLGHDMSCNFTTCNYSSKTLKGDTQLRGPCECRMVSRGPYPGLDGNVTRQDGVRLALFDVERHRRV